MTVKRIALFAVLVAAAALAANAPHAADAPGDYAVQRQIDAPAGGALLRLALDADVYRALRRADLGDLRVFNAAGEALPIARLPAERSERSHSARITLTPLPVAEAAGGATAGGTHIAIDQRGGDTRVRVDVGAGTTGVAVGGAAPAAVPPRYLADTQAFGRAVHAIDIPLPAGTRFEGRLRVEASADLADWRTLAADAVVLVVGDGDGRLARTRIELAGSAGGTAARYLRLTWLGAPPTPAPAEIELIHRESPPPERQWLALAGSAGGDKLAYLSPGLFPVDAARLQPAPGSNDVIAVQLASRSGVAAPWRLRATTVGYRLEQAGGVRESPPARFPMTRDPLWQVTPLRPELAGAPPQLELGWLPEEIVFVARGAGPYVLAVGHPDRPPAWLPIDTLVPGHGTATELVPALARLVPGAAPPAPVDRPTSILEPGRHWWLWAALVAGVLVLGAMARGVWREVGKGRE